MSKKKITNLDAERQARGKEIEQWRHGVYALLISKPKRGKVAVLKPKKPPGTRGAHPK